MPELNLGKVVGPQGPQGAAGPAGAQGIQGIQGVPGKGATINGYNVLNLTAAGAAQLTQDDQGNAVITASGESLLDNAYFADKDSIIDQRKGYVLVTGKPYYNNTPPFSDETLVDTVTAYTTVYNVIEGDGYKSFKLSTARDSLTYYAAPGDVVRGYAPTARSYVFDRWGLWNANTVALIGDNGVTFETNGKTGWFFYQRIDEPGRYSNKTVTLSMLFDTDGLKDNSVRVMLSHTGDNPMSSPSSYVKNGFASVTVTLGSGLTSIIALINNDSASKFTVKAAKLELGSTQTLAHQDADGNWVLNDPPPNRALELLKCQRYYLRIFNDATGALPLGFGTPTASSPTYQNIVTHIPVTMRANPKPTIIGKLKCLALTGENAMNSVDADVTSSQTMAYSSGDLFLSAKLAEELTGGILYRYALSPGGYLSLSAEL